jgi:hypothetical protein
MGIRRRENPEGRVSTRLRRLGYGLAMIQDVLSAVWAQAGIAPVLLSPEPVVPVNLGGSGSTQVGLTTGSDNTIPVDGYRLVSRNLTTSNSV